MAEDFCQVFYASPADLRSHRLQELHALWLRDCAGAAFPGLAAIDPLSLKAFLTDLVVADVSDPDQPWFRLVGTGFRDFFARNYTGARVRDVKFSERAYIADSYREVALSGRPLFGWYRWQSDLGVSHVSEFVVLPYGDDGKVTRLVVMEDLDPARQGIV